MRIFTVITSALVIFSALAGPAYSEGFGIDSTRLIYPEGAKSITTNLRNTMQNTPYLVHVTVDKTAEGHAESTPFTAVPPLFRLEPQGKNQVRIIGKTQNLPKDRESVFYFHAKAIPSSQAGTAGENNSVHGGVRFGVGSVIKVFYRPSGLPLSSEEAQAKLQVSKVSTGLKVTNPTPYFISFADLKLNNKSLLKNSGLMLEPFSEHIYPTAVKTGSLKWQAITDHGGTREYTITL